MCGWILSAAKRSGAPLTRLGKEERRLAEMADKPTVQDVLRQFFLGYLEACQANF